MKSINITKQLYLMKTKLSLLIISSLVGSVLNSLGLGIYVQPADQSVSLGADVIFSVSTVFGSGPLTYQWWLGEGELLRATNRSLALTNVQTSDAGGYFVVIADS